MFFLRLTIPTFILFLICSNNAFAMEANNNANDQTQEQKEEHYFTPCCFKEIPLEEYNQIHEAFKANQPLVCPFCKAIMAGVPSVTAPKEEHEQALAYLKQQAATLMQNIEQTKIYITFCCLQEITREQIDQANKIATQDQQPYKCPLCTQNGKGYASSEIPANCSPLEREKHLELFKSTIQNATKAMNSLNTPILLFKGAHKNKDNSYKYSILIAFPPQQIQAEQNIDKTTFDRCIKSFFDKHNIKMISSYEDYILTGQILLEANLAIESFCSLLNVANTTIMKSFICFPTVVKEYFLRLTDCCNDIIEENEINTKQVKQEKATQNEKCPKCGFSDYTSTQLAIDQDPTSIDPQELRDILKQTKSTLEQLLNSQNKPTAASIQTDAIQKTDAEEFTKEVNYFGATDCKMTLEEVKRIFNEPEVQYERSSKPFHEITQQLLTPKSKQSSKKKK